MARKPRVGCRIFDHENALLSNGLRAEGVLARRFCEVQSYAGFKPLPLIIEKRDKGHWRAADLAGEARQFIERSIRSAVEQVQTARRRFGKARTGFTFA